ncbi:MAG: DHH family phosphoesterase, partial [Candidatus Thorarchaeota archaeon]
ISIVYSKEKTGYRITARANKSICLKTGLHLGQILYELSAGKGGGHEGAASLNTKVNIEPFLEQLLDSVKKILLE